MRMFSADWDSTKDTVTLFDKFDNPTYFFGVEKVDILEANGYEVVGYKVFADDQSCDIDDLEVSEEEVIVWAKKQLK
jgi:hypothetical protein